MNIFLTGGSGGIGKEIIRAFSGHDSHHIYYTYCHHGSEEASSELVTALKCDLASSQDVQHLIEELKDIEFDVIINNAFPKLEIQPFHKTEWARVQDSIDVGVEAAFELTKAFSKSMKKRKSGHIINILSSSVLGKPPAQMLPYVIAKYALLGFHYALAAELIKSGVRVNAVSPHMVRTDFLSELPDHYVAMTEESLPGKRLIDPVQVAEKVKFLVSTEAGDINGMNIPILEGVAQ